MKLLIKNGLLVNPVNKSIQQQSVLIENGIITNISDSITVLPDTEVIDASNRYVMPGFVDMYADFMDPGNTESEDIESGSLAAAAGGYTTVCAMPNTVPSTDCLDNINYVKYKALDLSNINIIPISSMTKGQNGKEAVDFEELSGHGIRLFSEGKKSVQSAFLMNLILKKAGELGFLICDHCEDEEISQNGVINESEVSRSLNLPGIPNVSEEAMLARNLCLARSNHARYHVSLCSTAGSVELISIYKKLMHERLTASVSPIHLFFCDEDIKEDNADYKVNPPIRSQSDREALINGLRDGIIDVIASNHSPHLYSYKQLGFRNSPFGILNFQTAFSLCVMSLIDTKHLTLPELVCKLSYNPAQIIGLEKGQLTKGSVADICIADINEKYIFHSDSIKSKSKNTPLLNRELKGKIKFTIVNGNIVYKDMEHNA